MAIQEYWLGLFRAAIFLVIESICRCWRAAIWIHGWLWSAAGIPSSDAMAVAYFAATLLTGTSVKLPDAREWSGAIRTLGAIFVVQHRPSCWRTIADHIDGCIALGAHWLSRALRSRASVRFISPTARSSCRHGLGRWLSSGTARPRPEMLRQLEADPHRRAQPGRFSSMTASHVALAHAKRETAVPWSYRRSDQLSDRS